MVLEVESGATKLGLATQFGSAGVEKPSHAVQEPSELMMQKALVESTESTAAEGKQISTYFHSCSRYLRRSN